MLFREITFSAFNYKKRRVRIKYINKLLKMKRCDHHVWLELWDIERDR